MVGAENIKETVKYPVLTVISTAPTCHKDPREVRASAGPSVQLGHGDAELTRYLDKTTAHRAEYSESSATSARASRLWVPPRISWDSTCTCASCTETTTPSTGSNSPARHWTNGRLSTEVGSLVAHSSRAAEVPLIR